MPRPGSTTNGSVGPWPYNFPRKMKGAPNPNLGRSFPVEVLSTEEVLALMRACSSRAPTGVRNRALIAVLYRAGLRCAEALALRPRDVDLVGGAVTVVSGKGGKYRVVGLDQGGADVIGLWVARRRELGLHGNSALFCTLHGAPVKSGYVRALLPRLAARAGIDKRVHAHGLRHTHAFELATEGTPMPIIQRQLGHTHLVTTARYLDHVAPAQVLDAMHGRVWNANGHADLTSAGGEHPAQ